MSKNYCLPKVRCPILTPLHLTRRIRKHDATENGGGQNSKQEGQQVQIYAGAHKPLMFHGLTIIYVQAACPVRRDVAGQMQCLQETNRVELHKCASTREDRKSRIS